MGNGIWIKTGETWKIVHMGFPFVGLREHTLISESFCRLCPWPWGVHLNFTFTLMKKFGKINTSESDVP